jgi:hypothetical protein
LYRHIFRVDLAFFVSVLDKKMLAFTSTTLLAVMVGHVAWSPHFLANALTAQCRNETKALNEYGTAIDKLQDTSMGGVETCTTGGDAVLTGSCTVDYLLANDTSMRQYETTCTSSGGKLMQIDYVATCAEGPSPQAETFQYTLIREPNCLGASCMGSAQEFIDYFNAEYADTNEICDIKVSRITSSATSRVGWTVARVAIGLLVGFAATDLV